MKRSVAIFVIGALSLSLIPATANAATAIGSKCKRVNESKVEGKNKLYCVKSGSSLLWVKATDVTGYAFGPRGRLVYRYAAEKQERLSINKDWLKSDSRGEKSFSAIRVAAFKSIRAMEVDADYKNIEFEYLIRPSYPKELANVVTLQSKEFAKRLSPLLSKQLLIKLVLVTEKDQKYIDTELPDVIPKQDWQGALTNIAYYRTLDEFYSRGGTGGGTASFLTEQGFAYYIGHTSSLAKMNTYWPEIAPHEMAHVMQGVLANGFGSEFGEGDPRGKWHGHFIEGAANTFGMAMGFDQLGWYSDEMDILLRSSIRYNKGKYPMKNLNDAIFLINEIEKRDTQARDDFSYSAGQFVWEYFVGTYGADKFIELLRNVQTTESFDANIQKTIQITKKEFYQGAAEYLLASWKRLS
jgi:hypothetical protein